MKPVITAFAASPDKGRGLARDMPVRWALAEVGQAYDTRLLSFAAMKEEAHLSLQPFGQIPSYEDGTVQMFESGAIVLHIAQSHEGLLPAEPAACAKAVAWMFAAVSTIEPPIVERSMAVMLEGDKPWHNERLPMLEQRVRARMASLARHLGNRPWLERTFSAGDLLMIAVLRRLAGTGLLEEQPCLQAYVARGEARPAFQAAFAAQAAIFAASSR